MAALTGPIVIVPTTTAAACELRLTDADQDWTNTTVGFDLSAWGAGTLVRFHDRRLDV